MIRKVDIYIESEIPNDYKKIELFNDEKISLSLSVQNINDISKVYADYSQSFTIPASPQNNGIFKHFYQSDVDIDITTPGTQIIDHNQRRKAYIEIELTPFRTGTIQLEKANIKDNKVDSYSITFYGDLVTLKDKFGSDKLMDLDHYPINHTYTGAEVQSRITTTTDTYDVRYPMISSDRLWQITGGGANDITSTGHHVNYSELFPAVRVKSIFDIIASKYGITFTGNFLSDKRFTNLFLWYKNAETNITWSEAQPVTFNTSSSVDNDSNGRLAGSLLYLKQPSIYSRTTIQAFTPNTGGVAYKIDTYKNGLLLSTVDFDGTSASAGYFNLYDSTAIDPSESVYNFRIRTANPITLSIKILVVRNSNTNSMDIQCYPTTTTSNTDLSSKAPDMLVSDFFSAILREFNLTCFATSIDVFKIEPLDEWYGQGAVIDISQHIGTDSIDISRPKLYKSISFEYEKSESFLNVQFAANSQNREYGSTKYAFDYDGSDFAIKQPFENLLHTKFTGTQFQVAYALDKNYNKYIPKPCLLYMYDSQACSFKFDNNSSVVTITNYMPFGQEVYHNGTIFTSNFSSDQGTLTGEKDNNLYATYYYSYLANLFNLKQRLTNVKCYLPISLIVSLKLNDRLIIRDKRYIINDIKTDLTTGEVDLTLLNDFRPIMNPTLPIIQNGGSSFILPVQVPNKVVQVDLSSVAGATFSTSTITTDTNVTVTIGANPTTYYNRITEDGNSRVTEVFEDTRITEEYAVQDIDITHTYTTTTGTTYTETIYIQQL